MIASTTLTTRLGPFTIVAEDDAVLASGWTADVKDLLALLRSVNPSDVIERADLGPFSRAAADYHAGDLDAPSQVPVDQSLGPFVDVAAAALRTVPPGQTVSYRRLAEMAGRAAAVRAAANACAYNRAGLFVPCHRVLRSDGSLGGFRWGVDVKASLLAHEVSGRSARP